MQEHYNTLGVNPDASPDELKKAWKKQCTEHHPDKGGDADKFKKVMHSYKMLTDASYRHETREPDIEDLLKTIFRVAVSFEDAFFGRTVPISFNQVELGPDMIPLVTEQQEIICFTVQIPPGSTEGHQALFPGKGMKLGDKVGLAIVQVAGVPHPRFQVRGQDVVAEEHVALDVMLKGGTIQVETMYGMREVRVPAGTQPGARLSISRCGVLKRGYHFCIVQPKFPDEKELKTKKEWQDLKIDWAIDKPVRDPEAENFEALFNRMRNSGGMF